MSTQTPSTAAKSTAAERAHAAAIKHTAATAAEIESAAEQVAAAEQALTDAKAELEAAMVAKCADPAAAKERITRARDGITEAQDNLEFAILQHQAAEVVNRQACEDEQAAGHRVTAEEYLRAHAEWNSETNRERTLLTQLTDVVSELTVLVNERKDLHSRLNTAWGYIPPDVRPEIPHGAWLPAGDGSRLIGVWVDSIPTEVAAAIKAGAARGSEALRLQTNAKSSSR